MRNAQSVTPSTANNGTWDESQWTALLADKDATIADLGQRVASLQHQLEWFRRQIFGNKSERVIPVDPQQLSLGVVPLPESPAPAQTKQVPAHSRRSSGRARNEQGEALPFFDESRVPVETITLTTLEMDSLAPESFETIGEKITYKLAQRPASYTVIKYVRPLIKRLDDQALLCAAAPSGVIEGSRADVSLGAGIVVDKFVYHNPLYRQHQKLTDSGITVSRPWLTQLSQQIIELLRPIYDAQFASVLMSRVIAMDETPIKAGHGKPGRMKQGYFWPVFGEKDEVCFPFSPSRAHAMVAKTLGLDRGGDAVLLSDGYAAYARYAEHSGITHALCWAHARREFFEAQATDPQGATEALQQIRALYAIEEQIREQRLGGESKRLYRLSHSKPLVATFFDWIERQFERQGLLPCNPFTRALGYARARREGLEVFLLDPDVPIERSEDAASAAGVAAKRPIDTNHLERSLRAIPMGRRNWLFCSTELGAEHVGIVQSLLTTCRLHGVDPYTYLVDVLQRISQHPAARVAELTPRLWKQHFADNPLRSDIYYATK